jgi:HAD superfamily hydrolase (TIGR01509 family)
MTSTNTYKAVLLDLDGTIANSLPNLYKHYDKFLKFFGREGSPEEFELLNGPSMPEIMAALKARHQLPASLDSLAPAYIQQLIKAYGTEVPLFEGAREFIHNMTEKGIQLALVTSALRPIAEAFLQQHGLANCFCVVVTPEGLPKSKPHPAIYEKALLQMRLQPHEALAIEDSAHGVQSAVGAQISTAMILHPQNLSKPHPEAIAHVHSWTEMQGWMEK